MEIDHWHKFPIFKTQKVQCTEGLHQKSRTNYCLFLKTNAFSCFFRCQAPRSLVCETRESWAPGYDNSQPTLCQILIRSAAIAWTTDNLARFCTFFFQVNEFGSDAVLKCRYRHGSRYLKKWKMKKKKKLRQLLQNWFCKKHLLRNHIFQNYYFLCVL